MQFEQTNNLQICENGRVTLTIFRGDYIRFPRFFVGFVVSTDIIKRLLEF